ncbi:SHOCT domain-containing protein [Halovivax sp.]|uniref:SHOCT domain-containing protein n=1 Tax=Halovivax sp. TaxID=1935978 RepID=UPI0025BA68FF|nr:SHOCT domain-containing protein [Halovivax sp.]
MGRTGPLLVKGFGLFLAALLLLAAVATIVGIVLAVVATVVSAIVSLVVLGLLLAAAYGLFVFFRNGADSPSNVGTEPVRTERADAREPSSDRELADRLRERYVAGELDEAEFERRMELLLEPGGSVGPGEDPATALDLDRELQRE